MPIHKKKVLESNLGIRFFVTHHRILYALSINGAYLVYFKTMKLTALLIFHRYSTLKYLKALIIPSSSIEVVT